jgi:hypothetical protein
MENNISTSSEILNGFGFGSIVKEISDLYTSSTDENVDKEEDKEANVNDSILNNMLDIGSSFPVLGRSITVNEDVNENVNEFIKNISKNKQQSKKYPFIIDFEVEEDDKNKSKDENVSAEIIFSFDTTGSMAPIIKNVRDNLNETIERLLNEVKDLRIGLISHGDYCDYHQDRENKPIIWKLNPTNNIEALKKFIKEVPNTGGGDAPEAYELVLHTVNQMVNKNEFQSELKVLVMIGDEVPHEKGYRLPYNAVKLNKISDGNHGLNIDWKQELNVCKEKGITIFSCHALATQNQHALHFYNKISEDTGGYYFELENLQEFKHYMNVIVFKVADTADTIKTLKEKRDKMKLEIEEIEKRKAELGSKVNKTEDEIKEEHFLRATSTNLTSAFCDLSTFDDTLTHRSLFRSPLVQREFNTRSIEGKNRTKSYEENIKVSNRGISSTSTDFITRMTSEVISEKENKEE